jgi:hypothetical protein
MKNIKKYLRFSVCAKHRKMLSAKNIFFKNDFPKTILGPNKRALISINTFLLWMCHLLSNSFFGSRAYFFGSPLRSTLDLHSLFLIFAYGYIQIGLQKFLWCSFGHRASTYY